MSETPERQVYKRDMVDGFLVPRAYIALRYFESEKQGCAPVRSRDGAVRGDQPE